MFIRCCFELLNCCCKDNYTFGEEYFCPCFFRKLSEE